MCSELRHGCGIHYRSPVPTKRPKPDPSERPRRAKPRAKTGESKAIGFRTSDAMIALLEKLAARERRSVNAQIHALIDEALLARGIQPPGLPPE